MTITFAQKLERMPHYEAGLHEDAAREAFGAEDIIKLASNESPWGPHPAVVEAIAAAASRLNRYPDQYSKRLRRRIAQRFEVEPSQVAIGNGSCELLLAAAEALCEPGDEILFAWPSFSIYPHLAALTGASEIRVPLAEGYVHDLDAMLTEITAATQLVCVNNPNNPTGTHLPASRIAAFLEEVPQHVTVALDEAYIEFQTNDDPDDTVDFLKRFPNVVLLRTFSKVYGLAGLRCGYALGSAKFRAAVDAVRQPFSVNELAQVAGAEALMHGDDVLGRVERTIVERVFVEEGARDLGLDPPDSQANFSWIPLGDHDEAEVIQRLGERGIVVRGGTSLGGPGHIRVTYGTRAENERFLEALEEAVS
ncbi:MAG TPA: histidinol-phosphate transaminase [Solirubrobacterales bacterium]|jgi:histidinol-phosphate aminotransferase|nr:histidinol-phosphate transaminase [Solirubrobacterales bacterium]